MKERLSAIRVACHTLDELDYIARDIAEYVAWDRGNTSRAKRQRIIDEMLK